MMKNKLLPIFLMFWMTVFLICSGCIAEDNNGAAGIESKSDTYKDPNFKIGLYMDSSAVVKKVGETDSFRYAENGLDTVDGYQWHTYEFYGKLMALDENGTAVSTPATDWTWYIDGIEVTPGAGISTEFFMGNVASSSAYLNVLSLKIKNTESKSISITAKCKSQKDKSMHSGVMTIAPKVLRVASKSESETLMYAALSMLSYADLSNYAGGNDTVEDIIKPAWADGKGFRFDNDETPLLTIDRSNWANQRDLIAACAGKCKVEAVRNVDWFHATLFSYNGRYIMAFRGTNNIGNFLADIELGLGQVENDQFANALAFYNEYESCHPMLTGHSLGGGLANYVSVLTGAQARTFNAPSTLVTAMANFIHGLDYGRFGYGFTGLNDELRIDYVNEHDWVGKVGIGDSASHIWTGWYDTKESGNLDRTYYYNNAPENNSIYPLGICNDHAVTRLIRYNKDNHTVSLTSQNGKTEPKPFGFSWRLPVRDINDNEPSHNADYYFGSTGKDTVTQTCQYAGSSAQIHTGSGDDVITTSKYNTEYFVPGKGNDVINASSISSLNTSVDEAAIIINNGSKYYYFKGDGYDTINDHYGNDLMVVYGFDAIDVVSDEDDSNCFYLIDTSNNTRLAKLNIRQGIGVFTVINKNNNWRKTLDRTYNGSVCQITADIHCPVEIRVFDSKENLIETIHDGVVSSGEGDFGYYNTFETEDGFGKRVHLSSEEYHIQIVGLDTGYMDYYCTYTLEDEMASKHYYQIPIQKGALYYPSAMDDPAILNADIDGDGIIDYEMKEMPSCQLNLPESKVLQFGKTEKLSAVDSSDENFSLTWWSDDPDIVFVSKEGLIKAVGFGTTTIHVTAKDGLDSTASCQLTVPEEEISIEKTHITGIQEKTEYTGAPYIPDIVITYRDLQLKEQTDYIVEYCYESEPGTYSILIKGLGVFPGEIQFDYEIYETVYDNIEDRADSIIQELRTSGVTGEWETALWLHDWLIYNADYDYTYTYYSADGVLLKGTGVCQSYSEAYRLLLNKAGIENRLIVSGEMDHAWNLVKIDGKWCHIDCTWDDPGFGGAENHTYFGMNTALMGRDHQWGASGHPACDSLDNYYPLRMGLLCFSDESELTTIMAQQSALRANPVTLVYVGADPSETALSAFSKWYASYNWKYGLRSYGASYSDYSCTLQIEYTDPWEQPENHLFEPVPAPSFALDSPEGRYSIGNYSNNGIVLVFGRDGCMNTAGLFDRLEQELPKLNEGGIEVLAVVENAAAPEDLVNLKRDYDSFHYTYDDPSLVWKYLGAVGYEGEYLTYPCVFVINSDQMITYYSTGYVFNMDELIGEAFATATGRALPWPEKHVDITSMLNGTGNVNAMRQGVTLVPTLKSASTDNHVILVVCNTLWYAAEQQLQFYERHHRAFEKLGVKLIASFLEIAQEDKDAFPHCTFVDLTMDDFWAIQYGLGYQGGSVSYLTCLMAEKGGRIAAYTSGDTLKLSDCLVYFARGIQYDATIPSGLTAIEAEVFSGTAFRRLDLGGGALQSIGAGAFANCNPEIVRIPETVESIGEGAFSGDPIVICTIGTAGHVYAQTHGLDYVCE